MGEALFNIPNWELCHEMVENGYTVYQYIFEYINPKCFGWVKFLLPLISNKFFPEDGTPRIFWEKNPI